MFKIRKGSVEHVTKTVRMPKELVEKVDSISEKNHVSFSNLVIQCVEFALRDCEGGTKSE